MRYKPNATDANGAPHAEIGQQVAWPLPNPCKSRNADDVAYRSPEQTQPLIDPRHQVDATVTGYVLVFGVLLALFIFALAIFGGR